MGTDILTINSYINMCTSQANMPKTFFDFSKPKTNLFDEYNKKLKAQAAKIQAEVKKQKTKKITKTGGGQLDAKTKVISLVIRNDTQTPKNVNPDELAYSIVKAAQTAGVDSLLLTCICKQETHFDQNKLGKNGKGIGQITSIVPKDMYQRADKWDDNMKKLVKQYGSLDKIFAAKKANPKLNLGDFGEMLYKYKTPEGLYAALQKNRDLNLKCSAYSIKFQLKKSNGNIRIALENYNGSSFKKSYAKKIIGFMDQAKSPSKLELRA